VSRGRLRKTCPWHCSFFQPYRLREPSTALASNTHTGITSPNPRPRTPRTEVSPVLPGLRAMLLDSRRLRPNLRLLTSGGRDTRIPHRNQREMPATRSREYGGPGFALTTKQAVAHFHNVPDVRAEQGKKVRRPPTRAPSRTPAAAFDSQSKARGPARAGGAWPNPRISVQVLPRVINGS
jgi:hypothetical protein